MCMKDFEELSYFPENLRYPCVQDSNAQDYDLAQKRREPKI